MDTNDATCRTCPSWYEYPSEGECEEYGETIILGDCRLNPPTMMMVPSNDSEDRRPSFDSLFPYTESREWCSCHPVRQHQTKTFAGWIEKE